MLRGEVRHGFLKELDLHFQLAVFPLQLAQPCAVRQLERRLVVRVLIPVALYPAAEGRFVDLYLTCDLDDRAGRSTTILAASSLNSGE